MDGGKGGQTQSLQEREGENRRQAANRGRNGMERKKLDQLGQGDSSKKVTGRESVGDGGGMGRPEDA